MSQLSIRRKPENQPVTVKQIKQKRDALDNSPVTVTVAGGTYTIDCDPLSIERMQQANDNWIHLQHMKQGAKLCWITADNSLAEFTQGEFSQLLAAVRRQKAIRRDALFAKAQEFISQVTTLTARMIESEYWV